MVGKILSGKYEIKQLFSESHLYEIFSAVETETSTPVIIKILRHEWSSNPERVRLFSEEIRSFATLSHPSIAQILDIDVVDSRPYVVTEPVEGQDLRTWIKDSQISFAEAAKAIQQIATVIQYSFDQKAVNRSIKLSNVLRSSGGLIKILSFSHPRLRLVGASENDVTAGIQSDLFFLGTTFYELLTGESPVRKRGGINELWDSKLRQALRIKHSHLSPDRIEKVFEFIERTLIRDVKKRFSNHAEFLMGLADLIHFSGETERAQKEPVKKKLNSAAEIVDAIQGRISSTIFESIPTLKPTTKFTPNAPLNTPCSRSAQAAAAQLPDNEPIDVTENKKVESGKPFLRLIKGGKEAAERMIWHDHDDHSRLRNPLVIMTLGLICMTLLVLFW